MIYRKLLAYISRCIVINKKEQKHENWAIFPDEGAQFENIIACHLLKWVDYLFATKGREFDLRYFRDVFGIFLSQAGCSRTGFKNAFPGIFEIAPSFVRRKTALDYASLQHLTVPPVHPWTAKSSFKAFLKTLLVSSLQKRPRVSGHNLRELGATLLSMPANKHMEL
jgi:hypothetical protein